MLQRKKIRCNEGGPFNDGTLPLVTITLPDTLGVANLHNSEIAFRMTATCTANGDPSQLLLPVTIVQTADDYTRYIGGCQSFIRDAMSTNNRYGALEARQTSQNVLSANLDYYVYGRDETTVMSTFNGGASYNELDHTAQGGRIYSPFLTESKPTEMDTPVTALSVVCYADVRVPLSHVWQLARSPNASNYDFSLMGGQTIEINIEQLISLIGCQQTDPVPMRQDTTADASVIGSANAPILFQLAGNIPFTQSNLHRNPFDVGMPVTVAYTNNTDKTHTSTISSMNANSTTGFMEIVLATPAPTDAATDVCTDISLVLYIDNNATYSYNIMEVDVLLDTTYMSIPQQISNRSMLKKMGSIPFLDCRLTQFNIPASTIATFSTQLQPRCVGVCVFTPLLGELISSWDNVTSYELKVNTFGIINRNVISCGPFVEPNGDGTPRQVHNHLLETFFANIAAFTGHQLVRFDGYDINALNSAGDPAITGEIQQNNHAMYCCTTPTVDSQLRFDITLYANAAMTAKQGYLYSWHVRELDTVKGGLKA